MKTVSIILFSMLAFSSWTTTGPERPDAEEINALVLKYDSLIASGELVKYFYPNMSHCGGALFGYYRDSVLLVIDSKYYAEMGYSSRKAYWHEDSIVKIEYREHFAEWGKYQENYPPEEYDFDPGKMTFTDTLYSITLGKDWTMQKLSGDQVVSEKLDSTLIKELLDCGELMKSQLERKKVIKD